MLKSAVTAACLLASFAFVSMSGAATLEQVLPSVADPAIHQFNDPSLVLSDGTPSRSAPLAVFLPATNGRSETAPRELLDVIAQQGYRVIFLTYDDAPSVNQVCPLQPDPRCAEAFRERRVFGTGAAPVQDAPNEAIVPRLTALLHYLARQHPQAGWAGYLATGGQPDWSRIVVSGLSQGAGMAAFIAKRFPVRRVVLFSGPSDSFGPERTSAPWLSVHSATPPGRWWAALHAREKGAALLARSYRELGIPADQITVLDGPPPPDTRPGAGNPYHTSTIRMPQYLGDWRKMYGVAATAE